MLMDERRVATEGAERVGQSSKRMRTVALVGADDPVKVATELIRGIPSGLPECGDVKTFLLDFGGGRIPVYDYLRQQLSQTSSAWDFMLQAGSGKLATLFTFLIETDIGRQGFESEEATLVNFDIRIAEVLNALASWAPPELRLRFEFGHHLSMARRTSSSTFGKGARGDSNPVGEPTHHAVWRGKGSRQSASCYRGSPSQGHPPESLPLFSRGVHLGLRSIWLEDSLYLRSILTARSESTLSSTSIRPIRFSEPSFCWLVKRWDMATLMDCFDKYGGTLEAWKSAHQMGYTNEFIIKPSVTEEQSSLVVVMPCLGPDLADAPPRTMEEFWTALNCMLSALSALHARGLVHRDVHPENMVWKGAADRSAMVLIDLDTIAKGGAKARAGLRLSTWDDQVLGAGGKYRPRDDMLSLRDAFVWWNKRGYGADGVLELMRESSASDVLSAAQNAMKTRP